MRWVSIGAMLLLLVGCAGPQLGGRNTLAAELTTLAADVWWLLHELKQIETLGDEIVRRRIDLDRYPSYATIEALMLKALEADNYGKDGLTTTATILMSMSPEERKMAGKFADFMDFSRKWWSRAERWDDRYEPLYGRVQEIRTRVLVTAASGLPATEYAYLLGLTMNLRDELQALYAEMTSLKRKTGRSIE